jgi:protein-S-isoprenylcysteine O-methyltransferase Ste14
MELVHVVETIFGLVWAAFWIYWLVAAFSTKKGRTSVSGALRIRIPIVVVVFVLIRVRAFGNPSLHSNPTLGGLGLALFAGGLAFAIWARLNIGRNWGAPMSQKVDPELVTTGPYRFVRHPIYTGILFAGIGTAVALSWTWLFAVAIAGAYFIYSATVEERFMASQFPETYPAYKRSTKMLIPFIF